MSKQKKKLVTLSVIFIAIVLFVLSPIFPYVRSLAVMGVYSHINESKSLIADENIDIKVKGGLSTKEADWYPFAPVFNADSSYRHETGKEDSRLTIIYNFPSFSYTKGCSYLFDETSPYYNSFYGAYLIKDESNENLKEGILDEAIASEIAKFDFFELVLGDFGISKSDRVFEFEVTEREVGVEYVGYDGWSKIKADIIVNGSKHNSRKNVMSYLQYGEPNFGEIENEFEETQMTGIVYGRYFEQWDTGIYFYVMASS